MSIKFPDMQVLVGRIDQIPKILREGDPTGAGKVAPAVVQEHAEKPKKVNDSPKTARLRNQKRHKKESNSGSKLDIRI